MPVELETVEIATGEKPAASVIWLHGLGADGNDFVPIVPELGIKDVRFVFPHALVRPVTLNGGFPMRAWFDILDLTRETPPDREGMAESSRAVTALVERENARGIDSSAIVLAGFSQGGAMALLTGVPYPQRLAGLIGLSCWLPFRDIESPANRETPVFMAHGSSDPVVPHEGGERTRDLLREKGHDVTWHSYPMEHAVCPEEIHDIAAFLRGVLPAQCVAA